jgi:hypothetical protein
MSSSVAHFELPGLSSTGTKHTLSVRRTVDSDYQTSYRFTVIGPTGKRHAAVNVDGEALIEGLTGFLQGRDG